MQVYLDDESVTCARPTLAEALGAARVRAEERGRVIIEATLDGEQIPGDLLASPPDAEVSADELRFVSADPASLVRTILLDVADLLPGAVQAQRKAQEHLETGDVSGAGEHLRAALEVWAHVPEATLHGCHLLGLDIESVSVPVDEGEAGGNGGDEGRLLAVNVAIAGLVEHLQEVKRAQQDQDWAALADAVGYDLVEQATRWESVLRALADRATQGQSGEAQ